MAHLIRDIYLINPSIIYIDIDDRATVQPFSLFFNTQAGVGLTFRFRTISVFRIQNRSDCVLGHPALQASCR